MLGGAVLQASGKVRQHLDNDQIELPDTMLYIDINASVIPLPFSLPSHDNMSRVMRKSVFEVCDQLTQTGLLS